VVDTGLDYNHQDLAANIWSAPTAFSVLLGTRRVDCPAGSHGFNAITFSCDPMDDNGHGTHTSGTIGALGNNNLGVAGTNWQTKIIALKFLNSGGSGTTTAAINAIEFAIQTKAYFASTATPINIRVLSNSWGGAGPSQSLLDEINKANNSEMLFVVAAGNNSTNNDTNPSYPGSYSNVAANVITVAATDSDDSLAGFSNFGFNTVQLGAPGVGINSTYAGGGYAILSGTSMATPHVAGAALLTAALCPFLNTAALKYAILANVDPDASLSGKTSTGGRLNMNRAVRSCASGPVDLFSAAFLGVTGQDYVGPQGQTTANGVPDWHIRVQQLKSNPVRIRITSTPGGIWEFPFNNANWIILSQFDGSTNADLWIEPWSTPGFHVKVWYADGSTSEADATDSSGGAPPPDFSMSASPGSLTLTQGGSGTASITVTALNGFNGSISLGVSGCPTQVTCSLPASVTLNPSSSATLSVTTNTSSATGTFILTVTGSQGALSHSTTVSLTVNALSAATNVALASNGATAIASSTYSNAFPASGAINGDRKGLLWGNGGGWNDGTSFLFPDTLEVDFSGSSSISEIDVFTIQDNYANPSDPTSTMTFASYGTRDFEVQYWTGSAWSPIPGGTVTGNNLVWRKFNFSPLTTDKIRIVVTGTADGVFSRIAELEAWSNPVSSPDFSISASPSSITLTRGASGNSTITVDALNGFTGNVALGVSGCPSGASCSLSTPLNPTPSATSTLTVSTDAGTSTGTFNLTITGSQGPLAHNTTVTLTVNPVTASTNVALAANGATALASSTVNANFPAAGTNNGDRKGLQWEHGGGWNDGTVFAFPDTLEIDFNGSQTINEIDVFTIQDNYLSPIDPTPTMTFNSFGIRDFEVQYWNGSAWAQVSGGAVTGNNLVWCRFTFAGITTSKIRVVVTGSADGAFSRIVEVEAWTGS